MKQYYITIILIFIAIPLGFSQIVNIPDPALKNYLVNENCVDNNFDNTYEDDVDTNNDGEIQVSEAQAVLNLLITDPTITSMIGIEAFSNIEFLNVFNTALTEFDASVIPSVNHLRCSSTPTLTSIDLSGLSNVTILNLRDVGLTEVDLSELTNAQDITVRQSPVTTLDVSNLTNLETLSCVDSVVENLITDGSTNLKFLYIFDSNILSLDLSTNPNIEIIRVNNANLSSLDVSGLNNLVELNARSNDLTSMQFGSNDALTEVFLEFNELNSLSLTALPSLQTFRAGSNLLTSVNLSSDLDALSSIDLRDNLLTSLDASNLDQLSFLGVATNDLNFLNISNLPNLSTLTINSNNLTELDLEGTSNIEFMNCSDNLFNFLDFTNQNSPMFFIADNNPNLQSLYLKNGNDDFLGDAGEVSSFANCPNINFVCVDSVEEGKAQDLINNYGYTNVTLTTNCPDNPGDAEYEVIGIARYDNDDDGCDSDDTPVGNIQYTINDGNNTTTFISGVLGSFSLPLNEGDYTITPTPPNASYYSIEPMSFDVSFPADMSPFEQDICLTPSGSHLDVEVAIFPVGPARPGLEASYKIIMRNIGTESTSGQVTLSYDESVSTLINSNPSVNQQNANELIWDYNDLHPFEVQVIEFNLLINEPTDTPPITGGDVLLYNVTISPVSDENPENNENSLSQTVVNSYDPNNKICLQGDTITIEEVGDYLYYQINFENLGTANAIDIYIKDFINLNYFDITTLEPVNGSHEYSTYIIDNLVEFRFNDINLPFDVPNNTGYVVFKIKTKTTLGIGDDISNGSEIIFDFNEPIITNTAITEVTENLSVTTNELTSPIILYPNPTTTSIQLEGNFTTLDYTIYNVTGQSILKGVYTNEALSIENLDTGIYFMKISNNNRTKTLKFIKE